MRISLAIWLLTIGGISFQKPTIMQFEWSKATRGFEQNVRITADSVYVSKVDQKGTKAPVKFQRRLDAQEWIKLTSCMDTSKLKDIESLPSPTLNRASDQAMHSTLTITDNVGKMYTHGFDDENPNAALKPLLKLIKEMSGRNDRE